MPIEDLYRVEVFSLPQNTEAYLILNCENEDEDNCAIISYFQCGPPKSHYQELLHQILFHMIEEPAWDFLRTKEQLGYLVYTRTWSFRNTLGGGFVLQSSKKSSEFMLRKVNEFIHNTKEMCDNLTDDDFKKGVNAVLAIK